MAQDIQKAKTAEARLQQVKQILDGALSAAGILSAGRFRLGPNERKLWARKIDDSIDHMAQAADLFRSM